MKKIIHLVLSFLFFTSLPLLSMNERHVMHPVKQINFVKKQVKQQKEPYYSAYRQLIHCADSIVGNATHHALVNFAVPGYYDNAEVHRANSLALQQDAFAAYCTALAYNLSGDEKYGKKACYFLDAWSYINKEYSEHDGVLVMAYSGTAFVIAAELMSDKAIWSGQNKEDFRKWVQYVYRKATDEIRTHKNNWADWGRFGSLLAASYLNDEAEIKENIRLIKSDLGEKIDLDGSMPEETRRGNNGIWYTYFSLSPMTAAAWVAYNATGENLFEWEQDGKSLKKAMDYLYYYNRHPEEWKWYENPNTGNINWPINLFEAMGGIYGDSRYKEYVEKHRPVIYPVHHFSWTFPTLMPLSLKDYK